MAEQTKKQTTKKIRRAANPALNVARTDRHRKRRIATHQARMDRKRRKLANWAVRNGVSAMVAGGESAKEIRKQVAVKTGAFARRQARRMERMIINTRRAGVEVDLNGATNLRVARDRINHAFKVKAAKEAKKKKKEKTE